MRAWEAHRTHRTTGSGDERSFGSYELSATGNYRGKPSGDENPYSTEHNLGPLEEDTHTY